MSSSNRSVINILKKIINQFNITSNVSHLKHLLPYLSSLQIRTLLIDISAQQNKTLVFRKFGRIIPIPNIYKLSKKFNKIVSTVTADDLSNIRSIKSTTPSYLAFQLGRQHVYDYVQTRYKGFTDVISNTYTAGIYSISSASVPLLLQTRLVQTLGFGYN